MNPISERDLGALADAVRRRHRGSGRPQSDIDALEHHFYRVATLVDDLAEGESLNALDYQVVRVAAALHDAAATRVRPEAVPAASAAFAGEMLQAVGADPEFVDAVAQAIHRHAGVRPLEDCRPVAPLPETHAEMILHDACLLARMEGVAADPGHGRIPFLSRAAESMRCDTARRMASHIAGATVAADGAAVR